MAKYSLLHSEPGDTIITTRWFTNLWYCKGSPGESETQVGTSSTTTCSAPATAGCKILNRFVGWIFHNVAAAFFASLKRFSCINIDTKDDLDDNNYLLSQKERGCTFGGQYWDANDLHEEDLDV
ncbi:hypothetical protein FNV43_RR17361 [Rhamnella rubrinervis]|uniref:Uncharacterized protein n=1 Tax=Rhamnella rubrinervis TaxID=2594499 RepID=A0A8K0DYN1_9ROSA|nr:hypothetical protein FNV43_RR17361 [Rhamnella rubrinervis]